MLEQWVVKYEQSLKYNSKEYLVDRVRVIQDNLFVKTATKLLSSKPKTSIAVFGAINLLLLCLFTLLNSSTQVNTEWESAVLTVPNDVLEIAINDYFSHSRSIPKNQFKALKIAGDDNHNLYFIDFNSKELCGSGGCLYVLYDAHGKQFLKLLLNRNLPKNTNLVSILNEAKNGFPCLGITQSVERRNATSHTTYCYEGTGFVKINTSEDTD